MSDQAEAVTDPLDDLANALGEPEEAVEEEQVEGEAQQTEEPEEVAEEEANPTEPQKFRVVVKNPDGADEERELSLEELAQGYMLQSDYTRKTQKIAEQVQTQVAQEVAKTHQAAVDSINQLQALVLQSAAPELQNVDWAGLARTDPAEYVRLQARYMEVQNTLQTLESQKQQSMQQAQLADQQQREQAIAHSAEYLKTAIKGFDGKVYQETLSGGQKHYGFTPQELSQVIDGRMVHVLHDALQWRALQAQKPQAMKKVAEAPKVIKPAAPQPKNRGGELTKRLQSSGRVEDLAAFL